MKEIKQLFFELKIEIVKVILLNVILNTFIVFVIAEAIFYLFGLSYLIAIAVAIIFFIINFIENYKNYSLKKIEEGNPEIKEILRTARDNINRNDVLAMALFQDLLTKIKNYSTSKIISYKKLITKVLIILVLAGFIFTLGYYGISITRINIPYDKIKKNIIDQFIEIPEFEFADDSDIYGKPSTLPEMSDPDIFFKLTPQVSEITFDEVHDEDLKEFSEEQFPVEVYVQQDIPSEQKKPEESKLAKEYNLKLKELI